jgi:hypothetical protein
MKRTATAVALLAALGCGAVALAGGPYMSQVWAPAQPDGASWGARQVPTIPGLVGPWGQPVPVAAPYNASPPSGEDVAKAMLAQSMPLEMVQQMGGMGGPGNGLIPAQHMISPPGVPPQPGLPPGLRPPGAVAAVGALTGPQVSPFGAQRTEVRFVNPAGMKISWYTGGPDARGGFGPQYLEAPARYNFLQASIYRLKLSDIPNRPGVELYPTLEVVPAKAKTCTFLAHSAVPVTFTEEDFEQVAAGNFVVKVIYLPDPMFQDLAATGPDEVVSSRLEPGVDPICEAQRRGSILLVVRLGNIDLEAPNTPAMDAPNPFCPPGGAPHVAGPGGPAVMGPGLPAPGPQAPYGAMAPGSAPSRPAPKLPTPAPTISLPPATVPSLPVNATPAGPLQPTSYNSNIPARKPTTAELASDAGSWLPKPPSTPPASR